MSRAAFFLAVVLLAACSDDKPSPFDTLDAGGPDSGLPTSDVRAERPDRPMPDVVDLTDVAPKDAPVSDVPCVPTLPGTVRFARDGGLTKFQTRYVLTPPRAFRAERTGGGATISCETEIPACNTHDEVDLGEVNFVLGARDVQTAFGMATGGRKRVYGVDTRPFDGQVFSVSLDGATVVVGDPCRTGGAECLEIPSGLQRLVDVLSALRDQEIQRAACDRLRAE